MHANVDFTATPDAPEQPPLRAILLSSALLATVLLAFVGVYLASHSVDRPMRAASSIPIPVLPVEAPPAGSIA